MANEFTYGGNTILSHPIFVETILPFVLIFTIVFAVLQKSKIFGEDKRQIDSIVALVFGILVISFAQAVGVILQLIPFLAVSLIVILVLMILMGSFSTEEKFKFPKPLNIILIVLVVLAVVAAVVYASGLGNYLIDFLFFAGATGILANIIFIGTIVGAVIAVIVGSRKKKDKE